MITVQSVSKTIGNQPIVQDVSFTVRDGSIMGFVGPNGAGKSTTMRIMLGLTRADSGGADFDGLRYRDAAVPLGLVGSLLDARALIPNLRAREVLDYCARTQRVTVETQELLEMVGLADAGQRRVARLSLGMRQRLGIAVALIASPRNLVLDEPLNGLDPDGISWLRDLLLGLRSRGCAILLSSHIISELALIADDITVIADGRIVLSGALNDLAAQGHQYVTARTDSPGALASVVTSAHGTAETTSGGLIITGLASREVFVLAASNGIVLDELTTSRRTLDDIYRDAVGATISQESS